MLYSWNHMATVDVKVFKQWHWERPSHRKTDNMWSAAPTMNVKCTVINSCQATKRRWTPTDVNDDHDHDHDLVHDLVLDHVQVCWPSPMWPESQLRRHLTSYSSVLPLLVWSAVESTWQRRHRRWSTAAPHAYNQTNSTHYKRQVDFQIAFVNVNDNSKFLCGETVSSRF